MGSGGFLSGQRNLSGFGSPDVPPDTMNIPTCHAPRQTPATARNQLDYAFASRGLHAGIRVRALNSVEEWGASDHCRLLMESEPS